MKIPITVCEEVYSVPCEGLYNRLHVRHETPVQGQWYKITVVNKEA